MSAIQTNGWWHSVGAWDFLTIFRRLRDKLQPMSVVPYTPPTPHGNNPRWVRPDGGHGPVRDGLDYLTAWGGIGEIDWLQLGPDTSLWMCGQFNNADFSVPVSGTLGYPFDIRLDYEPDPGILYKSEHKPTGMWNASGVNGEYYLLGIDNAEVMLYEDGLRLVGCSKSSGNTKNLRSSVAPVSCAIHLGTSSLEIFSVERPFATGERVCIAGVGDLDSVPEPLARNVWYYAIALSENEIQFAATLADANLGTFITLTDAGAGDIWKIFHEKRGDDVYEDPQIGSLQPGEYWWEGELQRLYYKPTTGTPASHELRLSEDRSAAFGAAIYIEGQDYVRIFGGGEYGGLFGTAPIGKVGQCHTNAIQARDCNGILVDGVEISGCRSGVAFVSGTGHCARNNRVKDSGWHGIGGEAGLLVEDTLLHERNWVSDVARKHDFGDAQGIVFNRQNDDSIIRRNLIERVGRNHAEINTGAIVCDTSRRCYMYRNIELDCWGEAIEVGTAAMESYDSIYAFNIVISQNRDFGDYDASQCFTPSLVQLRSQNAGGHLHDFSLFGNLFAESRSPRAEWNSEIRGLILLRAVNDPTAVIEDIYHSRNAYLNISENVEQYVWSLYVGSTSNDPTFTSDRNLYAFPTINPFYGRYKASVGLTDYGHGEVIGNTAGFYSKDTGQETHSLVVVGDAPTFPTSLSSEILEYLRQDDEFDTLDAPVEAHVGTYPFLR